MGYSIGGDASLGKTRPCDSHTFDEPRRRTLSYTRMSDRFFVESPITSPRAMLVGPEAHHLAHVLRAQAGEEVVLFDGLGAEYLARVESVKKTAVELAVLERREIDREPSVAVVLCVALPKGDRQKWLVEKTTELGAAALVPLVTERGVAQPTDSALERLSRWVIEATKQCGRNRLLEIRPPQSVAELSAAAPPGLRFVAHPTAAVSLAEALAQAAAAGTGATTSSRPQVHIAVGPEGGFTSGEVDQLTAGGFLAVSLARSILRVETAALAALSVACASGTR